ncbi:ABC transporter ATP-binding protein [Acidovorax sp. sif1233]|uniref:ABC transporter ATP-binding protein n=1 Tax=Acidovorax sp. sif1233 TaxID=2854792 RepID=UPI001C4942B8|nr:ABC transporter ATP-binding protein [Acidovorax sp. sif1233]MBV7454867.1 ABC transporter ATP-binding protein [Acidovorax sp. sif1233]
MEAAAILETRALTIRRGDQVSLQALNLAVTAGSVYALLGGNGAGKTTTLNALLGFVPAASGQALVNGVDASLQPQQARAHLAYLPENVALYPYLSGVENLRYFCKLSDIALDSAQAHDLLTASGLAPDAQGRRVGGYSKGMRQKVGLAIAKARRARAMLLDEPTSGLDPAAANEFARSVLQAKQGGMAVLMATHDLFNAMQVADRIGILREGRLVAEFAAHDIAHNELERIYLQHARGVVEDTAP